MLDKSIERRRVALRASSMTEPFTPLRGGGSCDRDGGLSGRCLARYANHEHPRGSRDCARVQTGYEIHRGVSRRWSFRD